MPYLILCFRNLMCGKCTRSAAGSSFQRATAFGSSMRTSSTDVFLELLSLPFLTVTMLSISLHSLQPNLIPSALFWLFCVVGGLLSHVFVFLKWKKVENSFFFPFVFWCISVLLHGAWMYDMSGTDTISFSFHLGFDEFVCFVITSWKQY